MRKDKRLLVLLALGILILMLNNSRGGAAGNEFSAPHWLEIQAENRVCYRYSGLDQLSRQQETGALITRLLKDRSTAVYLAGHLEKHNATAVHKEKAGTVRLAALSPQLTFFLGQPLQVNIAGSGELALVPGIGPYLAENIMEYRHKHGRINSKKELTAVRGIGKLRAEKLSPFITFE